MVLLLSLYQDLVVVGPVDLALHLRDYLVYGGSVLKLGSIIADSALQDGRHLMAILASYIVLLCGLCHHEAHPSHPSVRLVLPRHALGMLATLKHHLLCFSQL